MTMIPPVSDDSTPLNAPPDTMRPSSFKPYGDTGEADMEGPAMDDSSNLDIGNGAKSPNDALRLLGAGTPYSGSK